MVTNSTQWVLYNCDSISCDLSNWFAELLFGIIIGVGILIWKRHSKKQRSLIFYQQIFDVVYGDFIESAITILKIQQRQEKEKSSKSIPSDDLTKQEFDEIQPYIDRLNKNTIRLQGILDASGIELSKDMQHQTQQLIGHIQFTNSRNYIGRLTIFNFKELLRYLMNVCNTHNMLKKKIKQKKENLKSSIKYFSEKKESKIEEFRKDMIDACKTELASLEKILNLTHNLKKIDEF